MSNNEDFEPKATEELTESELPEENGSIEEQNKEEDVKPDEAVDTAAAAADPEETAADQADPAVSAPVEVSSEQTPAPIEGSAPVKEDKKKKPFILQVPVLISLGIVLLALIGYLVYLAFFLHIPQGVIWSAQYENEDGTEITYYFEFKEDGTMVTTIGSKEYVCRYNDIADENGRSMQFYYDFLDFYSGYDAKYEITGSRLMKNQEITFTYGEGESTYSFALHEVNEKENPLVLPSEFNPDDALLGEWEYHDPYGYDYHLTFNDDGSMIWSFEGGVDNYHYSEVEHYTYTVENGSVNLTWQIVEPNVRAMEYQIDGKYLKFADMIYVRVDSESTPDETSTIQ